jgi:branched-chain amino acid transport system substrate-binding protein
MNRKGNCLIIVLAVLFVVGMAAANTAAADKVFKLGVMGPFTGPAAKSGTEMKDAATMALEDAGNKIGDYNVELVYIDDQSDPAKGTNAYAEAIERKGVEAGILNWNTAVTVAIQKMLSKYKVPHFFCMGAGKAGNDTYHALPAEDRYLIMKGWPIPQKLVVGYVEFLDDMVKQGVWKPQKKLVALWGEDTDWGRSLVGGMREGLQANGWEIFTEEYFALSKTDFYPFVNKCKNAGVTVLAGSSSGVSSVSALIKQTSEIGFKGLVIADGLGWVGDWYKMTGKASNGVLDMQPQFSTPAQKEWVGRFTKKFGYDPSPSAAGMSYDYGNFFIKIGKRALEKYGELSSATITKIGREEVITGQLKYSRADGALMQAAYTTNPQDVPDPTVGVKAFFFPVLQYEGGKGQVVFPADMKQADFMAPK